MQVVVDIGLEVYSKLVYQLLLCVACSTSLTLLGLVLKLLFGMTPGDVDFPHSGMSPVSKP